MTDSNPSRPSLSPTEPARSPPQRRNCSRTPRDGASSAAARVSSPSATTARRPGRSGSRPSTRKRGMRGSRSSVADAPQVSVLVPTHQRRDALRAALRSLARQSAPAGAYEVIVCVDGSTDGTEEMLAAFEGPFELRSVSQPQRGRAAACNAAFAQARGEVLIVLDDDMEVIPEFIERHRRHHPPGSKLCVLGAAPVELNGSSPRAARYVQAKFATHLARLGEADYLNLPRSFYTGNASLRAELLAEVGGFDESFTS